jgi:hypothetical protein
MQFKGLIDSNNPNYIIKLNKALYELKQSARIWYFTLTSVLIKLALSLENCIFINKRLNIILCVYVDDIAIIAPNKNKIDLFIKDLEKYFNIKNLSAIKDYLGIDINYNQKEELMKLSLFNYINKTLEKFNISNYKPINTFINSKIKLELNNEKATINNIKWH